MRCIFCKQESSDSTSVEHIIPESLGNTTSVLRKGVVCDKCNNYLARKVEKPFMDTFDIRTLRFIEGIPNKRGVVPPISGVSYGGLPLKIYNPFPGTPLFACKQKVIAIDSENENINEVLNYGRFRIPAYTNDIIPPTTRTISRFVAKVAMESLARNLSEYDTDLNCLIDDPQYDPLRNYVRFGNTKSWSCSIRRIYSIDKLWKDEMGIQYQVINESDFLFIPVDKNADLLSSNPTAGYLYFVLVLFGLEYVISIADSSNDELDSYKAWLQEHSNTSPLYYGKNQEDQTHSASILGNDCR